MPEIQPSRALHTDDQLGAEWVWITAKTLGFARVPPYVDRDDRALSTSCRIARRDCPQLLTMWKLSLLR